jgi:hypothetical protein
MKLKIASKNSNKSVFKKLIILFLFPFSIYAQPAELFTLFHNYDIAGVDIKGNSYYTRNNTLYKYDISGKQQYNYSHQNLGKISKVNISNPFKITVLYADPGIIILLDNTLSPVGSEIHLHQMGFDDPIIACPSEESGFWIYDASSGMFSFLNWNGLKMQQSVDVRRLYQQSFFPEEIALYSGFILVYTSGTGVLMLDNAGNVIKTFDDAPEMKAIGPNGIYFIENDKITVFDPVLMIESSIPFQTEEFQSFALNFPYLLVQSERKISLFLLTTQK